MYTYTLTPAFYDTDGLGHINNTRVPQWFEAGRNELFRIFTPDLDIKKWQLILARVEVDYLGQRSGHEPERRAEGHASGSLQG
jgi:acyl-CoA thioester hydrolase